MTPTSATGSPRERARQARPGFTLVELMMTVAIIGLAAGAVVVSIPDPRPPVGVEAERFAARLTRAREEAVMTNRAVAVEATPGGYDFTTFDGERWLPLTQRPFGPERWSEGTRMVADIDPARVVFDPTGVSDPAVVTLSRDQSLRRIRIDGAGEVTLDD